MNQVHDYIPRCGSAICTFFIFQKFSLCHWKRNKWTSFEDGNDTSVDSLHPKTEYMRECEWASRASSHCWSPPFVIRAIISSRVTESMLMLYTSHSTFEQGRLINKADPKEKKTAVRRVFNFQTPLSSVYFCFAFVHSRPVTFQIKSYLSQCILNKPEKVKWDYYSMCISSPESHGKR